MIHFKPTKKLFYGKWLYKVSYNIPGCSFIRHKLFSNLEENFNSLRVMSEYHRRVLANKDNLLALTAMLDQFTRSDYDLRIETDIIDVYTNQEIVFNTLTANLTDNIRFAQKPDDPSGKTLSDKKTILVKKYPQDRFKMRVYLKPHKMDDPTEKLKYLSWLKSCHGVSISQAVETWFYNTKWNWDRRYVLIDDDKTLLLLKLKNDTVIGSVYNLVLQE